MQKIYYFIPLFAYMVSCNFSESNEQSKPKIGDIKNTSSDTNGSGSNIKKQTNYKVHSKLITFLYQTDLKDTLYVDTSILNDSGVKKGFLIVSNVKPYYLMDIVSGHSRTNRYVEFLNDDGLPVQVTIGSIDEWIEKFSYKYDENKRIKELSRAIVSDDKDLNDQKNFNFSFSDVNDSTPTVSSSGLTVFDKSYLIMYKALKVKEFISKTKGLKHGVVNQFDKLGRVQSSIDLKDTGLDYVLTFEKYIYNSQDKIWSNRKVEIYSIIYDKYTFDKKFSTEVDNDIYDFLKNKLLKFPDDFNEKKKIFTETRIVKKIAE